MCKCVGNPFVPSEQGKPAEFRRTQKSKCPYWHGRPENLEYDLPLVLCDPVFAKFIAESQKVALSSKDYEAAI
jgi:hypothetical protein